MGLREDMMSLIPDDLDEADRAELERLFDAAIEAEKDIPGRPVTPEDLEGIADAFRGIKDTEKQT